MKTSFNGLLSLIGAIAVFTTVSVCFSNCSSEDDFGEMEEIFATMAQKKMTRAGIEGGAEGGVEGDAALRGDECGYWALLNLGGDKKVIDSLLHSKGWTKGAMTNHLVYEVGQKVYGFSVHKMGEDAHNYLLYDYNESSKPDKILVYYNEHIAIMTEYSNGVVYVRDNNGHESIDYYKVTGLMY